MIIGASTVWLVATLSDVVNSTFVFIVGNRLRKSKGTKKYIKWRKV